MVAKKGAQEGRVALAALLAAAAAVSGAAAQVPCSVAKDVAPHEVRHFRFQRAGSAEDLLCVFTFQTQLGAPLAVVLDFITFDNMTDSDCECGALSMYDVSPSGELLSDVRRCAGEAADGAVLLATSSVAVLTLATRACPAPAFVLSVGAPELLGVTPGDGEDSTAFATTTTTTRASSRVTPAPATRSNGSVTPTTRPQTTSTRTPAPRTATTSTTTTEPPTRRAREVHATSARPPTTTTKGSSHWWSDLF